MRLTFPRVIGGRLRIEYIFCLPTVVLSSICTVGFQCNLSFSHIDRELSGFIPYEVLGTL